MDWEEWYLLAVRYAEEHGDLLVPKDYVCPSGERLGRWIERQRGKYNRVPSVSGGLSARQTEALDRIGMVWKLEYRRSWEDWLDALDRYAAAHGDADVPHAYEQDGFGLGDWLAKQRLRRAAGELDGDQIADLESRGVRWSLRTRPRAWEDWFAQAEAYYRAHGNLLVGLDEVTPDGGRLGYWIYRQRDIYMGRKQGLRLTQDQIDRLNRIGMVWEPLAARGDAWDRMYLWVARYARDHRRLPLWPPDLRAPDGRSAAGWIRTQRQSLADGRVSPERAERLARLGIVPAERRPRARIS